VFVNENNGYGISCPQCNSMAVTDIADRAAAYDMPGVVVDGNDVLAVFEAVTEAVKRARRGEGPSLIECKTYRWRGHFEGDACTYRCDEELKEWMAKDPIPRMEEKLLESGVLKKKDVEAIRARIEQEIKEAVDFAEGSAMPAPAELLEDVYA